MLFNSFCFSALLVVTCICYWVTPWQRGRLLVLLVASFVFYGWSHPPSMALLALTIGVNYALARLLAANRSRWLLGLSITLNLSVLAWFKYAAFAIEQVGAVATWIGVDLAIAPPSRWLPLGISFFTFQVIAYHIDVYRGDLQSEKSLLVFGVFKSFFAQLIAGPIVRAKDFLPELRGKQRFDINEFALGVFLIIVGLSLKVGVADVLAQFADVAFSHPEALATNDAWLGLYAYGFQLFADFWGYSTVAVGIGHVFGFHLPLNFDAPYTATSLRDFWRRWHITLSAWFRDYLYIPLGGNRHRESFNLVVTMALAGLWHGASWTFVVWGTLHGAWLALEHRLRRPASRWRVVFVFQGVMLLWVLFRAPSLAVASAYFQRLLLPPYTWNERVSEVLVIWLIGFLLLHPRLSRLLRADSFNDAMLAPAFRWTVALGLLALGYASTRYDFIYFKF